MSDGDLVFRQGLSMLTSILDGHKWNNILEDFNKRVLLLFNSFPVALYAFFKRLVDYLHV